MEFSNTTNKNGILQLTEGLLAKGNGGITSNTDLKAEITGYVNLAYSEVVSSILTVDKRFRWDDSNYTNFPIATSTLVDNQRDYILPAATVSGNASSLLRINRVKIRQSNGEYYDAILMEPSEQEDNSKQTPTKFRVLGNSIRFKSLVSLVGLYNSGTDALVFEFQRSFEEFTVSDTTKQPGFSNLYHHILAYKAAAIYAEGVSDFARSDRYYLRFESIKKDLLQHYSNKIALDNQPSSRITPLIQNNR